jgi:hypothetical protein
MPQCLYLPLATARNQTIQWVVSFVSLGGNALCTILFSVPRLPLGKRPYGEMLAGES